MSAPESAPTLTPGPQSRPLGVAVAKAAMLVGIIAIAFALVRWGPGAGLLDRDTLLEGLERLRRSAWAAPTLVALLAIVAPSGVPVTPLLAAGALLFGIWWGTLLNLAGLMAGGALGFFLAHSLGRDLVLHMISPQKLERARGMIEQHGFWALVRIRFLPIPYGLVNYAAALAGIPFRIFFSSTLVGLTPVVLVQAFLVNALFRGTAEERPALLWSSAAVLLVLFLLTWLPGVRKLRQRWRGDP